MTAPVSIDRKEAGAMSPTSATGRDHRQPTSHIEALADRPITFDMSSPQRGY
jgi:hypothetical protein